MTTTVLVTTIGAILMGMLAMFIRLKAIKKPASIKKIVLPPIFMSTGFLMFLYEPARPAPLQVLEALAVGMVFSIFLIKTSKFEIKGEEIYLKRSKAFMFILIGLLLIRILFKLIIGDTINMEELSGMFFLLAYGMIIPWRISMFLSFRKIQKELKQQNSSTILAET